MDATRLTLLQLAGGGEAEAWTELDRLYRPFVHGWFRAHRVPAADADDLTQEVLSALFRELPAFEHSGREGAFRAWLRAACLNRLLGYRRAEASRRRSVGEAASQRELQQAGRADPNAAEWDREHDRAVLRHLFSCLAEEFEPGTLEAFRRLAIDGQSAAEVASAMGLTTGAVYVAKSRVLRRLREEGKRLLGEDLLD